jgi:DNA invertase Pin-like site-specific DNA recombinase
MKSIFKLKEYPYQAFTWVKEEDVQKMYEDGSPTRHVPRGFYSKKLTFEEWLNYYKFKIL